MGKYSHTGFFWCRRCRFCFFVIVTMIRFTVRKASYFVSIIFCFQLCLTLVGSWYRFDELCGYPIIIIRCSLCVHNSQTFGSQLHSDLICFHSAIVWNCWVVNSWVATRWFAWALGWTSSGVVDIEIPVINIETGWPDHGCGESQQQLSSQQQAIQQLSTMLES